MAADVNKIYVYDDFSGPEPLCAGYLYVTPIRGGESCAFEYDEMWLNRMPQSVSLDPELMPFPGRQYAFPIRFILRLLRTDRFRIDQRMNFILCHGDSSTVYEPGMVEAVAYSGGKIGRDRLLTAGDNLQFNMPEYGWLDHA